MRTFESMEEAFAYCRRRNQPTIVQVNENQWKIYPSGKAEEKPFNVRLDDGRILKALILYRFETVAGTRVKVQSGDLLLTIRPDQILVRP